MSTICKAYLMNGEEITEFIVNFINLSVFVKEHRNVKDLVIIGPLDNHFVLSLKNGKIDYCSDSGVRKVIETELKQANEVERPKLHLYKGIAQYISINTINIASTSLLNAKDDLEKWTNAPLCHLIKVA